MLFTQVGSVLRAALSRMSIVVEIAIQCVAFNTGYCWMLRIPEEALFALWALSKCWFHLNITKTSIFLEQLIARIHAYLCLIECGHASVVASCISTWTTENDIAIADSCAQIALYAWSAMRMSFLTGTGLDRACLGYIFQTNIAIERLYERGFPADTSVFGEFRPRILAESVR